MSSCLGRRGGLEKGLWEDRASGAKPVSKPPPLSFPSVSPEDGPGMARTCWVFSGSASPDKGPTQGCICGSSREVRLRSGQDHLDL